MLSCNEFGKFKTLLKSYKVLRLKKIITQNTDEFCRETTLHGVKYVANSNLKLCDRCFFGVSIISVIMLFFFVIGKIYDKWSLEPVIVAINPKPTLITSEPFPAVTICNLNKALKEVAEKIPKNSTEYTALQLLCNNFTDINKASINSLTNWSLYEDFANKISQPCEDMFRKCNFGGHIYDCKRLFQPIITQEGLCCTFNMLHPKYMYKPNYMYWSHYNGQLNQSEALDEAVDWNAEAGYSKNLPPHYYPRKIHGAGKTLGLSVTLDVQRHKHYCFASPSEGFMLGLHKPNEMPNLHETGIYIEPGKETKLRIRTQKTETDQRLRRINKRSRYCVFSNEEQLKYYAHYTQKNCELECIAEKSLEYCGCISYSMSRMYSNVQACSTNQTKCELAVRYVPQLCVKRCLPSCYEINFNMVAFSTKLVEIGLDGRRKPMKDVNSNREKNTTLSYMMENLAIVHLYYGDTSFNSNVKREYFGHVEFLSNIGGLLGLFLGCSLLSIIECIYYGVICPLRTILEYRTTVDVQMGLSKVPSSLERSKKKHKLLRQRYRKIFLKSKVDNEKTGYEKGISVPYSITYGFDAPEDKNIPYFYLE